MSATALLIRRIGFTAADLARTADFYTALGFAAIGTAAVGEAELAVLGMAGARAERLSMRLGPQEVEFLRFDPPGRAYPDDSTSTDLWFQHIAIAVSDIGEAYARVMAAGGVAITEGGPQTLPPNTGGVTAFKFRDPEGHPLELLAFPPGIGDEAWHAKGAASPFLGIDHTAIAVSDTARSRAFYEGVGFRARPGSENVGPGQQHLDAVAADRVAVVPLVLPQRPPHLELLGYAVGTRRPMPPGTRAADLWATRLLVDGTFTPDEGSARVTRQADGRRSILIRDPDGHELVVTDSRTGTPARTEIERSR